MSLVRNHAPLLWAILSACALASGGARAEDSLSAGNDSQLLPPESVGLVQDAAFHGGGFGGGGGFSGGHIGGGGFSGGHIGGGFSGGHVGGGFSGGHIGGGFSGGHIGGGHIGGGHIGGGHIGGGHIGGGHIGGGHIGGGHIGGGHIGGGHIGGGHIGGGHVSRPGRVNTPGAGTGHARPNRTVTPGAGTVHARPGHVATPGAGPVHARPGHVATPGAGHANYHGNRVPPAFAGRIQRSQARANSVMRRDAHVASFVKHHAELYRLHTRPIIVNRYLGFQGYRTHWHPYFSHYWYPHHFYGFAWPIVPVYNIETYYWYPTVSWLFCDEWDDAYYGRWYGPVYEKQPELRKPFYRVGAFYPTQSLRDLLVGVSSFSAETQVQFRLALTDLVQQLESKISASTRQPFAVGKHEIVVTKYQLIGGQVVLEGFVAHGEQQYAFKALLDLKDYRNDQVFVPTDTTGDPAQTEVEELKRLNDRIVELGGEVDAPAAADAGAQLQ